MAKTAATGRSAKERPIRLPHRQDTALEAFDFALRTARAEHRTRHAEVMDKLRETLIANIAPATLFRPMPMLSCKRWAMSPAHHAGLRPVGGCQRRAS